ncbi:tripartite tricarboxylate transporter substrate binding protein [Siccirubricoccus sp. KC 17139]|uniref:Tripartite tricarboxylate transporter substrate binding protein n=1 Tax=Siccirubricoccus soli TaxID=2899147 RepID=A0ABT1D7M5_9PROT|nr:tripartite tricarboxylate transporter substrate binding protein [Siccirubricoccus soli]MCO6416985.1 tripartite tricarboxylate transporter substrate binding protein [Siccirubricoccus soli]MCP2683120.1 tripartite tricarboxylate transporter substrate binding protein [Siccirubricoccus soli]
MRLVLLLLLALLLPGLAAAQGVTRDVRLIVPYAPGGTVDLLARILAEGLAPALGGRNVVVENRSGAGTFIAMQAVANAPADGHTLSLASNGVLSTAPVLPGMQMPIDPDRTLLPLTNLIRVPIVLVGKPDAPFANLQGLIDYARASPGRLNIGQSGLGGATHLLAARLMHAAGISMEMIQYRGGTPALLDIISGNADLYFSLLPESLPHIREGRLRAIAFTTEERNPALPAVPTAQETLPGFTGDVGYGVVMAAGTSPAWVAFWNAEINKVMHRPELRAWMEGLHWILVNGSPEAYREALMEERRIWGAVIAAARISGS